MKINDGKVTCILVSGDAGVGKDTVSDLLALYLEQCGLTVSRDSLALTLKLIARRFLGWNGFKDDKGRTLLQDIGETGRNYDEYVWCKSVKDRAEECIFQDQVLILSDWRYMNEKKFFEDDLMYDVVTVRVLGTRKVELSGEQLKHKSETDIDDNMGLLDFDIAMSNREYVDDLQDWIMDVVYHELIGE